jgi:DNA repair protein RadC
MRSVRDMPAHSRPRELLQDRGQAALSDEQLVMAIIGSGGKGADVRKLARSVAGLIREHRGRLCLEHLTAVPGIGVAKASQILSAFELARRHLVRETATVTSAQDAFNLVADLAEKKQEHFVCISLNGANEVIETRTVTIGLVDSSPVHPREVFADVISDRATGVIFAHNHPSGNLQPSNTDSETHHQLTAAAEILGIRVLDHLIVSKKGYFSFKEAGLLAR